MRSGSSGRTFFKIRSRKSGLFSLGGERPRWSKTGKTWNTKGALTNHLVLLNRTVDRKKYENCEVVEFSTTEALVSSQSLADRFAEIDQRRAEKEATRKKARRDWVEQEERRKARELIKKYGKNP